MAELGFLPAFAVVRLWDYDFDAVVQTESQMDPRVRWQVIADFLNLAEAEDEARRLNAALEDGTPIYHYVQNTHVEVADDDPRFTGLRDGAGYVYRRPDEDLQADDLFSLRRYGAHWEHGSTIIRTRGFDTAEEGIAWARALTPSVLVTLENDEHYSAGERQTQDWPPWPPPNWPRYNDQAG
jgi:hypothetical protein